jgi:hypothetical protein
MVKTCSGISAGHLLIKRIFDLIEKSTFFLKKREEKGEENHA